MALKRNALLRHLAQISEAHHLKPAAIGQNRLVPIHKLVQPAQVGNPLGCRAQHQMISIAQQNIRTCRGHTLGQHRLDGCRRAHRHKRGRADVASRGGNYTSAGFPVGGLQIKCNTLCHGSLLTQIDNKEKSTTQKCDIRAANFVATAGQPPLHDPTIRHTQIIRRSYANHTTLYGPHSNPYMNSQE